MPIRSLKKRIKNRYFSFLSLEQARRITPKPYLDSIGFELASHCNLHCYSCDHFSQLSKSGYYDLEQFERDCKRLYELSSGVITSFTLFGGEPLLNKQCASYFAILHQIFPKSTIYVITNGTLLLKQSDRFWQSARENQVVLQATKYPIEIDWEQVKEKCAKEQVQFVFYNDEKEEKLSFKTQLDKDGRSDPFVSFVHCHRANACTQIHNGKIYPCAVAANAKAFNQAFGQDLQSSPKDYIDIYDSKMTYEKILDFLARPIPFCRYCKTKDMVYKPWSASKRSVDEYF